MDTREASNLTEAVERLRGVGFDIDFDEGDRGEEQQKWLESLLMAEATSDTELPRAEAEREPVPSSSIAVEKQVIDLTEEQVADEIRIAQLEAEKRATVQSEKERERESEKEREREKEEEKRRQREKVAKQQLAEQKRRKEQKEREEQEQKVEKEKQKQQREAEEQQESVWTLLCAKTDSLRVPSRQELTAFQAPLNGTEHKDIYAQATNPAKMMVVDVPADGSCLFHAVFSNVWRELTGEIIQSNSVTPLDHLWAASRLYEFDTALAEFSKVQTSAALGAIWRSCTHAMRLFVVATWCFGGDVLTSERMRSLLCDAQERPETESEQYAITMWITLAQSIALHRYIRDIDSESDPFVRTMTIALAAQHLVDTVDREAKALRSALLEHSEANLTWSGQTSDENRRLRQQLFAGEGYERSWFGTSDLTLSGCIALTYPSDPVERHLYPKSYWASVSACEPLAEALGFNIYVLDAQAAQPATDRVGARSAQVNVYPFIAPTPESATRDIVLYVLGDRNHFGYGLPIESLQEDPTTGCLTQINPAFRGSVEQMRSTMLAMCNKWIAQHYEDDVPNVLSALWKWNNAVAVDQFDVAATAMEGADTIQRGIVGERMQCVFDSMEEETASALQTADRRLRRDATVLLRAWTVDRSDFDKQVSDADAQAVTTRILRSADAQQLSLLNNAFDIDFSLLDSFVAVERTLEEQIYEPLAMLVQQVLPSKNQSTSLLKDIAEVRENRPFAEYARRIHSAVGYLISVTDAKIQAAENAGRRVVIPDGLSDLIDVENAWFERQYLPFEKSLRNLSETAIRYVLARLRNSQAAPCVVPLYFFGEQVLFVNRHRIDPRQSISPARSTNVTAADVDLYMSSVENDKRATPKRMLDIAIGKRIKKVVKRASLVEFVEQYLLFTILEQYEIREQRQSQSEEFVVVGLETVPPIATGFVYTDSETPGRFVYLQDIVEQSRTRRRGESLEPVCSVRKNGRFDGDNVATNMLALLEPNTCLAEHFGWIGPQLRGLTLSPGVGQVDLLALASGPEIRSDRLVGRLYSLFNIVGENNVLSDFVLRSPDTMQHTLPTDESSLLSPLFRSGGESADALLRLIRGVRLVRGVRSQNGYLAGFYGNAPTDWLLRNDLLQFLESNEMDDAATYLDWALLNGTTGERRNSVARSLGIERPSEVVAPAATSRHIYVSYVSERDKESGSESDETSHFESAEERKDATKRRIEQRSIEPERKKRKGASPTMHIDRPTEFEDVQVLESLEVYRPVVSSKTAIGQQTVFTGTRPTTESKLDQFESETTVRFAEQERPRTPAVTTSRQGVMTRSDRSPMTTEEQQDRAEFAAVFGRSSPLGGERRMLESSTDAYAPQAPVGSPLQFYQTSPLLETYRSESEQTPKFTLEEAERSQRAIDRLSVAVYAELVDRLPIYAGLEEPALGSDVERFVPSFAASSKDEQQAEYRQFLDTVAHGLVQSKADALALNVDIGFQDSENVVDSVNRWLVDNRVPGINLTSAYFRPY